MFKSWIKESNDDMYFSGESTKNAAVGFWFNRNKSMKVTEIKQIETGKIIYQQYEMNNIKYNLINFYGPNYGRV